MPKDFRKWHERKSAVDTITARPHFHEREVWFAAVGANVGVEQDGRGDDFLRPVVIVRKFNSESFWGVPLTKAKKHESRFYVVFSFQEETVSAANLSQLRLMDARRLAYRAGEVAQEDFTKINEKLKALLP